MGKITWKKRFICHNPVPGNRYEGTMGNRGSKVHTVLADESHRGISLWWNQTACSHGINSAKDWSEVEQELKKAFEKVEIAGFSINMTYEKPIKI